MRQLWAGWLSAGLRTTPGQGFAADTPRTDTTRYQPGTRPRVAPADRRGSRFSNQRRRSPLVLPLPDNVKLDVQADDSLQNFDIREGIGSELNYRDPSRMTFEEYSRWQQQKAVRDYFRERAGGGGVAGDPNQPDNRRLIPKIYLGPMADRIFGGSYVDIRPQGAVTLRLGYRGNRNENPTLTLRQQKVGDFQFDQNMNLNLTGQIGEKLRLSFNYDTRAAFDFENNMKLDYTGFDTDIIRKVELGNVSLPLNNSLITGAQNLFGVKAQLQFGRLGVTTIASTVRGQADEIRIQNGGQSRAFEIKSSQYEKDRHFFLNQVFRERYNSSLRNLPTIQSGINITYLEVWVTNDNRQSDNLRNVVTLMDVGEPRTVYRPRFLIPGTNPNALASDSLNSELNDIRSLPGLFRQDLAIDNLLRDNLGLVKNQDFEHVRARKLDPREYTYNPQLGYLSLNTQLLPEQVLGVSYQYTYNGKTYTVGEIQTDYSQVGTDQVIFLKMLKATNPAVGLADPAQNPLNPNLLTRNLPTWDLMMKNIYPLNANQLNRENFQLQIIYKDDITGVDLISLKEGDNIKNKPLIEVFNLDNVNPNNDRNPDGNFDFFPGITIDTELGRIIFPEVEPFGNYLAGKFDTINSPNATAEQQLARKYVYRELYNQVQSDAQQRQEKDKFYLRGRFQAVATDEINLPGIGIAEGSVRVRAGSTLLQEGTDYQVFYDQAKVKILNPAYLNSANELRVEFEKNALVQVQPRKLLGARFDYRVSSDMNFGATVLHLRENQAPGINRVNIGDEPGNNTLYGFDVNMRRESRAITKYLDALPFISTKEISTVSFSGEFAQLLPAQSKLGSDNAGGENGVSYLDDFENARTPYTLGGLNAPVAWRLGATPLPLRVSATGQPPAGLATAFNRAKLAWYTIDQTYYTNGQSKPQNVGVGDLKNHYVRGIKRTEVFPNRDVGATGNSFETTFDLAYFPDQRGQYNYTSLFDRARPTFFADTSPAANADRQAAISREILFDTDFDNANVEYLEFWMMDPFLTGDNGRIIDNDGHNTTNTTGGDLYVNLGSVSEDVLEDGNQYEFENGIPANAENLDLETDTTAWGRASRLPFLTDAFSATPGARAIQDVGLDGIDDAVEQTKGDGYAGVPDPAGDNFRHHLDPSYDQQDAKVLARYKDYNGMQGNSPEGSQLSSTAYPDKEDLNRDNVLSETERYYEYRMRLNPGSLEIGQNYIVDKVTNNNDDTNQESVTWYQFRIPVRQPSKVVGTPGGLPFGFKSIRFLRMYLTGWEQPVVLRLVQPQFVANQWRRYLNTIAEPGGIVNPDTDADEFNISTVSIEENGRTAAAGATAIPYLLPPNIRRDKEYGSSTTNRQQNEQSLRLVVGNLRDGFAKAAYKNLTINMLRYKRLRLFLHAESLDRTLRDGQVRGFVRLGTDYIQNYYEYALPLQVTPQPTGSAGAYTVDDVWPVANRVDLPFQQFIDAKAARNAQASSGVDYTTPFVVNFPDGSSITVVGNPDLSSVQGAMIGLLNPRDDGASKSLTLWADELRVLDFENESGWAATARFNTKLADVANITATGSYISTGFGGLQDRPQQRSIDNITRGDVNATVAADKFFPEKLGLRIPVLLQAGIETRAPKYDPLDPDTRLTQSLEKFDNDDERAAYRKEVIDQTSQRSVSLLNVRKERTNPEKKVRPYDIENIALSYSYTERNHTDIRTDRDYTRTYTGALAYVYQTTPRTYTPLAKVKAFDSPYLAIFKEVNFTPLPSRFSFRADLDRRYNERFLQRTLEPGQVPVRGDIPGVFLKSFFLSRIYDLRWDLTKALAFDYTATNRSSVDEGRGSTIGNSDEAQRNRQQLRDNLLQGGRTINFNQRAALTYRLPLDKFPLTDWLSADARYAATYTWQAASTALRKPLNPGNSTDTTTVPLSLGNTIENNREVSANGKIDLVKLYNKVRFLNIINNAPPPQPRAKFDPRAAKGLLSRTGRDSTATVADSTKGPELRVLKAVLRSLMTARSLNFTYTRSNGTRLPGYLPGTTLFGFDKGFDAPGVGFILGQQYSDYGDLNNLFQRAYDKGWYTDDSQYLNTALSSLFNDALTLRTTLEPIRDFNIQLDARKNSVSSRQIFYRSIVTDDFEPDPRFDRPQASSPVGFGTFSISFVSIQTLFGDLSDKGETSKAFNRFINNRELIQQKLQDATIPNGFGYNSQDVLLPAFLDAYRGRSSDGYAAKRYKPTIDIPIPNWTITYNGLSELPLVQRYFRSFRLNHAYNSVYTVAGYTTSATYTGGEPNDLVDFARNTTGQFIPYYIVGQTSIAERLSPLIGVDFQTSNRLTGRLEYRLDRTVGLNPTVAQVTELRRNDMVIGVGFATDKFRLPFRVGGEQKVLRNELNARLDLSISDNFAVQRTILDVVNPSEVTPTTPANIGRASSQVTNGTRQVQLRPTVDYVLNQRLNLQFFFTRNITTPRVQNAFKNTSTEAGIQLRYSLSQ